MATFTKEWDCPVAALFATHEDHYRKPATGMWDYFSENLNDGIEISLTDSYYVGDAAGRDKGNGRTTKDHGYGDRGFAVNVGVAFFTPEMFFLN
jgi:bifunctional polynucleotide phosphatase/kinase